MALLNSVTTAIVTKTTRNCTTLRNVSRDTRKCLTWRTNLFVNIARVNFAVLCTSRDITRYLLSLVARCVVVGVSIQQLLYVTVSAPTCILSTFIFANKMMAGKEGETPNLADWEVNQHGSKMEH